MLGRDRCRRRCDRPWSACTRAHSLPGLRQRATGPSPTRSRTGADQAGRGRSTRGARGRRPGTSSSTGAARRAPQCSALRSVLEAGPPRRRAPGVEQRAGPRLARAGDRRSSSSRVARQAPATARMVGRRSSGSGRLVRCRGRSSASSHFVATGAAWVPYGVSSESALRHDVTGCCRSCRARMRRRAAALSETRSSVRPIRSSACAGTSCR